MVSICATLMAITAGTWVAIVILGIIALVLIAFAVCEYGPADSNTLDAWLDDHVPLPPILPDEIDTAPEPVDPVPQRLKENIDGRCEYCDAHVVEDEDGHLIPITLTLIQVRERIGKPYGDTRLEACPTCYPLLPSYLIRIWRDPSEGEAL